MTYRDDLRAAKALQGADFPTDRATLIEYARTREVDAKTLQALHTVPDRTFTSMDEVVDAVAQEPEGEDRPGGTER